MIAYEHTHNNTCGVVMAARSRAQEKQRQLQYWRRRLDLFMQMRYGFEKLGKFESLPERRQRAAASLAASCTPQDNER
jgi:hypothetical protein